MRSVMVRVQLVADWDADPAAVTATFRGCLAAGLLPPWLRVAMVVEDGTTTFKGTIAVGALAGEVVDFGRIPSYDYFDLTLRFHATENVTITTTVQNLFDKKPPIVGSGAGTTAFNSGNTYPSTYDSLGRRYAVSAKLKF